MSHLLLSSGSLRRLDCKRSSHKEKILHLIYTWCVQHVHLCVNIFIYMYSINKHSFPAALLVSKKLKNSLQKWCSALPNQQELHVLQHSGMATVMWANIFRLLPGGAVLCMSQFSKSIKVMQLLDQQMSTKGKTWQKRLREKRKSHGKKRQLKRLERSLGIMEVNRALF